ncbi:uncharacterized protein MELLADRAFT_91353 [Melampsora larici-populina 98AG31]|uniref:Cell morphogenesis protein N-terminal domain-containing protein n=1 Tax=Melampsora larici-populina (strain 98AG31 / pathotype 3-4-7) TaxID=747676 RepID=F4RYR4_MELLP|nr:uncharacterized protein MELLADRAFT_91353 [Melampsora larici-populina 98AG31]EGG02515.1 hypothetical protein MELLADRAFT_91353 [Melampsora larici-populina 98AG31]
MQIEIPDFDDDTPFLPTSSFGTQQNQFSASSFSPSTNDHHERDGSSSSSTHHHQQQQSTLFSFTSPLQSSSRPFGGQSHQPFHLINHHPNHHHLTNSNLNSTTLDHEIRTKSNLNHHQLHASPTSPSPNNSQLHQNLLTRSGPPRKLSVASLRTGVALKSSNNNHHLENSRLHRNNNPIDLLNTSIGLSSPFSPNISPGTSTTHHGRSPRSRSDTTTTSTTHSANTSNGEAHSPLEVAIYLIMDRFFEECEIKLGQLLGKAIPIANEDDFYIPGWIGQGVDPSFDATFDSLAQVSRKNPNQVINFVMRWKSRQGEGIDEHSIQRAISLGSVMFLNRFSGDNTTNPRRVAAVLAERKGLALVYLLCRALIAIVQGVTRESLGEELGSRIEEIVFNSIKNADTSPSSRNPNKQANMNMFAQLLGALSNIRFASVSDRFASEIDLTNRAAAIKDQKDSETRLGFLIRGVQYLKLKVYPLEAFEETAEFIAAFAIIFEGSRGSFVKTAMAETLNPLLAQVVQSATAEVNHPVWNKAIVTIFNKAHSMSDKPSKARYWNATVPLICSVVGAAPQDFLLAKWPETIDWCFGKLKEKTTRPTMMLGIVQLVWAYLRRVREGASALNKRLEPILKSAFPADRKNVYPAEVSLDTFASLIHYILHWQLEYGSDFTLRTLLTGSSDSGESGSGLVAQAGSDRITIGITATLRALTSLEAGEDPLYPVVEPQNGTKSHSSSSHSLHHFHPKDPETDCKDGMALKPETLERPRIKAFVDAVGTKVLQIAAYCDRTLATYTLTNDRYIAPWHDSIAQRAETLDSAMVIKRHGYFAVEYPRHVQRLFDVLQTCLQAWPRILTSSTADSAALDILFRGLISLDVGVTIASKLALRRFVASDKSYMVLQNYTRFLAKPEFFFRSKPQLQKGSDNKVESLVKFWVEVMSTWCDRLRKLASGTDDEQTNSIFGGEGLKFVSQMEATSLVLLCSRSSSTRKSALDALRITGTARTIIQDSGLITTPKSINFTRNNSVANVLDEAERYLFDTILPDDLPSTEKTRLLKWKKQRKPGSSDSLIRLLESDNPADMTLLCIALSSIFSTALKYLPQTMVHARTLLYSQLQRIYPLASDAAGVGGRSTVNGNGPNPGWDDRNLLTSWSSLLISLTSITTSADPKVGNLSTGIDNSSIAQHSNSTRERSISPGEDLIKTLVPFLTSDQSTFREATIRAMSCIHVSMYETLLDGLSGLAHHLTSERKMIEAQKDRSARPNGTVKIIRLFSAIGKLHESTTKFLFHLDFNSTDRCIEILVRFIKETCLFLKSRQSMEDFLTVSIRKSFLIFSERVFKKIGLKDFNHDSSSGSTSLITVKIHQVFNHELVIDIFNLAEDWSTRLASSSSTTHHPNPSGLDPRVSRINSATSRNNPPIKGRSPLASTSTGSGELLLHSATMIATLCETALDFRSSSGSPQRPETSREPTTSASRMLRWITALFEKNDAKVHAEARRAFVGACKRTSDPDGLLENALTLCWNESDCWPLEQTLFGIMCSTLICEPSLRLREEAILALCLSRISHPELTTRQRALDVLKFRCLSDITPQWLSEIEVGIQSAFAGHHLVSQTLLSKAISDMKTIDPSCFIVEVGNRILQVEALKARPLVRLMPTWLAQINLAPAVCDIGSSKVKNLLSIVLLVSSQFVEHQPEAVSAIWLSFADASPLNTAAIITFLLDETKRRGLPAFVRLSRTILSSMTENTGLEVVARDLVNTLQPAKLLAPQDPAPLDSGILPTRSNDLDTHFPQLPSRTVMSHMQAAILLLGEAMVLKPLGLADRLSSVVHAYVVQADHTNITLQAQMREVLVRYVYMLRRMQQQCDQSTTTPNRSLPLINPEDKEAWRSFWDFEETSSSRRHRKILPRNLEHLVEEISQLTSYFITDFCQQWAKVAIEWATQCPVRHVACRSLQVLRILGLPVDSNLLAELLIRLSNTASDPSQEVQLFALEVLTTLSVSVKVQNVNQTPFAQLFWTGVSCLETCNELEFLEAIELLGSILEPLEDSHCFDIEGSRPTRWLADGGPIRQVVMKGLRSSSLCQSSWSLIRQFLSLPESCQIVDWVNGGCALLYSACLPWCLHILETGIMQYEMDDIAIRLAHLTSSMGMEGLSRVMISFAKRRFRTNDDFLKQAINGIREYFLPLFGNEILILYFGFLLNPLDWIKSKTLIVLKVYIKLMDLNSNEILELGYDLLTPVLNLLQTNLSLQALEILSEPIPIKGKSNLIGNFNGIGHHHHHYHRHRTTQDQLGKKVFGNPDETGWCVANGNEALKETRMRLVEVIESFGMNQTLFETLKRSSVVEFTYEWGIEVDSNIDHQTQSDLAETNESFGEMVSTLHDLSDFFGQDGSHGGVGGGGGGGVNGTSNLMNESRISSPLNPSTARVAAILSRSLSKRRANRPSLHVRKGSNLNEGFVQTTPTTTVIPTTSSTTHHHPHHQVSLNSRPGSLVGSTSYSESSSPSHSNHLDYSQLHHPNHHYRTSVSTDYDDIDEEDDDEEDEEEEEEEEDDEDDEMIEEIGGSGSGLVGENRGGGHGGSGSGSDDSLEVFGLDLEDDDHPSHHHHHQENRQEEEEHSKKSLDKKNESFGKRKS